MRIVFDETKRLANLEKHGFDFADFGRFEWATAIVTPARETAGSRARYKAAGWLNGRVVAAIFSPLGSEAISLISLRPANRKERQQIR